VLFSGRSPHLLIQAVIAFAGGIAGAAYLVQNPILLFPAVLLLALAVFLCWFTKNALQLPLLLLFWFVCGLLHGASLQPPSKTDSLYRLFASSQEVTLVGTLLQAPAVAADTTRLLMQADAYLTQENNIIPEVRQDNSADPRPSIFKPAQGNIELTLRGPPPEEIRPGQRLLVRTLVSRPRGLSNPGGFDYRKFLAGKSIWVTGWISSPAHITTLPVDDGNSFWRNMRFFPEQVRYHINQFLTTHLAAGQSSLYMAILTGERAALSPATLENFKATGAIDLLAISGLHMGLIALGAGSVINWLIKRSTWLLIHTSAWKTAVYLIMPILCGYALIAGLQTPVVRSLIMISVFLLAVLFDRQWHFPTNIAIAALIILLINPAELFNVSFQLSFAAVIAIAAIMPQFMPLVLPSEDKTEEYQRKMILGKISTLIKGGFFLSLAALAGILPLLVFYFNRFSPLSTISTLLLEPLLCYWALPLGLISVPFIFFAPDIARLLLTLGAMGVSLADRLCAWLAALPFSSIWLPTPLPLEIVCYYALLFSILFLKKSKTARLTAIISIVTLLITTGYIFYKQHSAETDTITVLDVGQGNAVVIELAGGFTALIDGGGSYSPHYNVGERVIAPFLWSRRISHLDAVVISHPDADHFNGLDFIIKRFRPETIWINGGNAANASYTSLLDLAGRQGAAIRVPRSGETLFASSKSRFSNVADIHLDESTGSENDRSLAMRLTSQGKDFLFTGDIGEYAEQQMAEEQKEIQADVLLLAHHGSSSSTSAKFLSTVAPEYAVISAGHNRNPLFPAPEVINRCRSAGCTIYNTAQDGAVIFTVADGGTLAVSRTLSTHR
jgi:competence protein ComEC